MSFGLQILAISQRVTPTDALNASQYYLRNMQHQEEASGRFDSTWDMDQWTVLQ